MLKPHSDDEDSASNAQKMTYQQKKGKSDRYVLQFYQEADEEIQRRKEIARHSLEYVTEDKQEINGDEYFPKEVDFPKRPEWSYDMSREEVEMREQRYFTVSANNVINLET